jgi:hypothetical protein
MVIKTNISIIINHKVNGIELTVANDGDEWSKSQLGVYADKKGVYIHHSDGVILYIGQTTSGKWATFGERLRREFQKKASQNSPLYNLLLSQKKPIRTIFLVLDEIDKLVNCDSNELQPFRKALILEQVLIGMYSPEGNKI